jgi:membrane protein DedA with SNARE-associated domain
MPYARFLACNVAGGILWALLFGIGSALLGSNIHHFAGPLGFVTGVVGGIAVIAGFVFVRRNQWRLEEAAEKALPGSLDDHQ